MATNAGCKVFVLSRRKHDSLTRKIRRLESDVLANQGAKHVQFSPDGQWLLMVRPDNTIHVYRVQIDIASDIGFRMEERPLMLKRIERASLMKDPLRTYRSTVCKVTWSEDSKIIVSGDLDGNLDVWTFQEHVLVVNGATESGPPVTNGHTNGAAVDPETSDDSDDESSAHSLVEGSAWQPARSKLPKLSFSPLLLSFRPTQESDDRLVVVTLRHEILEFHTRTGRLTDWSKRNPSPQLPPQFTQIKDRAMGCVWDCSNQRQRLWLYGSNFLFMLDMSKDLTMKNEASATNNAHPKRKRAQGSDGRDWNMKKTSGAGGVAAYPSDFGLAGVPTHSTTKSHTLPIGEPGNEEEPEEQEEQKEEENENDSDSKDHHQANNNPTTPSSSSLLHLRRQPPTTITLPTSADDNEASSSSDPQSDRKSVV